MPAPGERVVVRRQLSTGQAGDVLGVLLDAGDPLVIERDAGAVGEIVRISRAEVVAMKSVPPRPVRASEIRSLDTARARASWSIERRWIDGWLCRRAPGIAGRRANSATALLPEASAQSLPALRQWYAERDAPLLIQVSGLRPDPSFTPLHTPVDVLVAGSRHAEFDPAAVVTTSPGADWLTLSGTSAALARSVDGAAHYATLQVAGIAVAAGRLSVTADAAGHRWGGLSSVAVPAPHRRQGYARRLVRHLLAVADAQSAARTFLEVTADNDAAQRLYRSTGFVTHHSYAYWSDPT